MRIRVALKRTVCLTVFFLSFASLSAARTATAQTATAQTATAQTATAQTSAAPGAVNTRGTSPEQGRGEASAAPSSTGTSTAVSTPQGAGSSSVPADLPLSAFRPRPRLIVPETDLRAAKFAVVDVHSHFRIRLKHDPDALEAFIKLMDRNNIAVSISLDGGLGDKLDEHMTYLWTRHKDRFAIFANIDWQGNGKTDDYSTWACHGEDFAHRTVMQLEDAAKKGVCGVKVFKSFGLEYRNPDGTLIKIDDPRFAPIWDACGRLGLPVIMHTADPRAFFEPITPENERYEELSRHPEWHFPADRYPTRDELHAARNRLFAAHPRTLFIAAHLGNDGEDLKQTAAWLDQYPNLVVEFASRISELGRQPYTARDFLIKYQDRILFGTDGPWPEERYRSYWRFLETKDEYFPYSEKEFPPQGLWRIYGVYLPDEVLRKIYSANAARLITGIQSRLDDR